MTEYLDGRVTVHGGNCMHVIKGLADASIDSVVTDPPYALVSISKRFGKDGAAKAKVGKTGAYARASSGFMGKQWDTGDVAFAAEFWAEVLRVLKPGGHVLAFGGTRTYHRLAVAIEDAGFEIRDQIGWAYGSGFPKSHNLGEGWGTALKPAWEPICMARKPLDGTNRENMALHGVGGLNVEVCRVATGENLNGGAYSAERKPSESEWVKDGGTIHSYAGKRFEQPLGRWPANIIHDGSDEVLAAFPDTDSGGGPAVGTARSKVNTYGDPTVSLTEPKGANSGSAARFFYSAKADADDRVGSKHPTVKPVDLMQYLVRLVTPLGGTVLDPFAGTGTTGEAAFREGMKAILIEREPEYLDDIARRMDLAINPTKRAAVAATKNKLQGAEGTPLFGD